MTPPAPAAGWDAERLAVVIQHAIYCSPYDALCAAKEVVSAFPRPTAASAEAMREAAAKLCDVLRAEADAKGFALQQTMPNSREQLYHDGRCVAASKLARAIRALPIPQPAGETGDG